MFRWEGHDIGDVNIYLLSGKSLCFGLRFEVIVETKQFPFLRGSRSHR